MYLLFFTSNEFEYQIEVRFIFFAKSFSYFNWLQFNSENTFHTQLNKSINALVLAVIYLSQSANLKQLAYY